jgi:predicted RNA-binding protein with RPS1 domain
MVPVMAEDEEDFAALFAASEATRKKERRISPGDQVRGRIIEIGSSRAFVDIGAKAEAILDLAELRDASTGELTARVGDEIEAHVTDDGRDSGTIVLRRTMGRGAGSAELQQAFALGIAVEGVVKAVNKGGFDVQIGGVRAFCPGSQIDVRRNDAESYVGQRLRFKVTKLEGGGRNVVVSRRDVLEEEARERAALTWKTLEVGAVVSGTVVSLRDFGAFVDLGGVEGMIHVSELAYARSQHPSEVRRSASGSRRRCSRSSAMLRSGGIAPRSALSPRIHGSRAVAFQSARISAVRAAPGGIRRVRRDRTQRRGLVHVSDGARPTDLALARRRRSVGSRRPDVCPSTPRSAHRPDDGAPARRAPARPPRCAGRRISRPLNAESASLGTLGDLLRSPPRGAAADGRRAAARRGGCATRRESATEALRPMIKFDNRVAAAGVDIRSCRRHGWIRACAAAAAVSRAGAMGIIGPRPLSSTRFATRSAACAGSLTGPSASTSRRHRRDPGRRLRRGAGRALITTGGRSDAVHVSLDAGLTVFHVVPTLRTALKAVDAGVDGLVVEGGEGGGFKNPRPVSTMVLLPLVRSRVDVPIIAGGGFCDGASMAAAFALGAEGVQMGTRMVSSAESPVHDGWKRAIVAAEETGTVFLRQERGPALRALRTQRTTRLTANTFIGGWF